ncbi:MAG TPA: immunoglobulin domain-containing protein, partial [Verrucomicrobiae bacterium]|nr:immunoglobulin domain-containing protein [Verrucomicrobiae bacterium]
RVKPSITSAPQSQTVVCGSVTFSVAAAGSPPLSYQWRKGGTDIPGANANTYTIDNVSAGDAGNYSVRVENDVGFTISDDAVLTVSPDTTAPAINCPPGPIVAQCSGPDGATINYTVTAKDDCDPAPTLECFPASGSTFGVGSTIVRCSARDSIGNSSLCSFEVQVQDNTPALLTIVRDGDNVTISWPQTCTTYSLEEKAVLDDSVAWSASGAAHLVGSSYQVTVSAGADAKFFRLHGQILRRPAHPSTPVEPH